MVETVLVAALPYIINGDGSVHHRRSGVGGCWALDRRAVVAICAVDWRVVGDWRAFDSAGQHAAHGALGSSSAADLGSESESYDCGRHSRQSGTGLIKAGCVSDAAAVERKRN